MLEIFDEEVCEGARGFVVSFGIGPAIARDEDLVGDIWNFSDGLEAESRVGCGGGFFELSSIDGADDGT